MSSNPTLSIAEGEAPFEYPAAGKPLKTWYKVTGDLTPTAIPLIILHGGPGVGSEAYNILSDLTVQYGIPIIQYDQVGCKRSSHLQEKLEAGEGFWNEELFIAELNSLIRHFGLDAEGRQYDIIGHSWGAMFGSSFAARKPKGLRKFIAWSSAPSLQLWIEAQNALRKTLPPEIQDVLDKCEKEGATNSPEYQGAMMQFYGRFMVRLNPPPAEILDGLAEVGKDPTVYLALWGNSGWAPTGPLKNWSSLDKLSAIDIPVLLLNGRYDQAQDSCVKAFFDHLTKVKWVQFAESAHMAHFEERERYMQVVGEFLRDKRLA